MFSFLISADYQKQIQDLNLQQVIGGSQQVLISAQLAAQAKAKSYLVQRYDTAKAFVATTPHDQTKTYKAAATVYLTAPAYDPIAGLYALGSLTLQLGSVYRNITAITVPEVFTAVKWTLVNINNTIYNAALPYPVGNALFKSLVIRFGISVCVYIFYISTETNSPTLIRLQYR